MILKFEQFNEAKKYGASDEGKIFSKKDLKKAMTAIEKSRKVSNKEYDKAYNSVKKSLEEYQSQTEEKITKSELKKSIKSQGLDKELSDKLFKELEFLLEDPNDDEM